MSKASIVRRRVAPRVMLAVVSLLSGGVAPDAQDLAGGQPLASIRAAAEARVRSQLHGVGYPVRVQAAEPDPRLHLLACPAALATSLPGPTEPAARLNVRVSCAAPGRTWAVFVPVVVESDIPVLVLRQSQIRGARLGPQEVTLETRTIAGLGAAYLSDVSTLSRRTLVRPVAAGTALTADLFQSDLLIRQGQAVTLVAAGPGLEVRAPGRAMEDGREGAHVRVQNLASQRVVLGVVDVTGVVYATP
jgi:flagella basal body P-ring formation protein FlgA